MAAAKSVVGFDCRRDAKRKEGQGREELRAPYAPLTSGNYREKQAKFSLIASNPLEAPAAAGYGETERSKRIERSPPDVTSCRKISNKADRISARYG